MQSPSQKRLSPWAYFSIKYKLSCSITLIVLIVAALLFMVSRQASNMMNAAYAQSNEYHNINSLQQNLISADEVLQTYISNVSSRKEYQAQWDTLSQNMQIEMDLLNTDLEEISLEQYFLATALQTGYAPYLAACKSLLFMGQSNTTTVALYEQYETVSKISAHLQNSALLLQTEALNTGHTNLATLRLNMERTTESFTGIAIFLTFLLIFLVSELVQVIVVPILRLAEASAAVRDGNFDTPDIEPSTRDEIYTLAISFNEMKRKTKASFYALQHQTEMEQALHQKELEAQKTSALLAEAQMQQLRNQINPHFLFNTLNIISRTARSEKAPKSEKLILALARLFRYGLKTDADEVPLAREINIVNDYIAIQSTRFADRVALRWRISPEIDPETLLVPTFLLQPLVENAVIHGLEPKLEGGTIRIRVQKKGEALHFILTDNGVGMTEATRTLLLAQQQTKGHVSGIGVGNVRRRLQLLYPAATFSLISRPGWGTRIEMMIPATAKTEEE